MFALLNCVPIKGSYRTI